jgi:hypothetical protein
MRTTTCHTCGHIGHSSGRCESCGEKLRLSGFMTAALWLLAASPFIAVALGGILRRFGMHLG